jgi:phosphoribosyl 1,2-cyclic phosphodiesterase
MSVFITSLNSGSNGNCYYVGNNTEAVLVDVGISCRETERRMTRLGLSLLKVKAIFISHEHSDHIRGVEVLSKKYKLPVYITSPTLKSGKLNIEKSLLRSYKAYQAIRVGDLSVFAFPKLHDAADPYSFIVDCKGLKIGVFTDIGSSCEHVVRNFKLCHAIFLEANYDEKMLTEGNYPFYLKNRIRSDKGHLSNDQALDLFIKHKPAHMSHVFLSHLSKDNNDPQLVHNLFAKHAQQTNIIVASRYKETSVYHIKNNSDHLINASMYGHDPVQLSLFNK